MPVTVERAESKPATRRSVFILRFISTIALWTVALVICFSGYEFAFFALISIVGLIALWEFYGMLDYKGLPNFKLTGMICGAVMLTGSFYYFSHYGPARSYDFEVAVLLFFLLTVFTRQMFDSLRDDAPLQTMAYTLFGLLYVLWLFNFILKIVYVVPRSPTGMVTGQFYCLYLIAITKFSDMGAYLTGSVIGRHQLIPHISPKKTWEGFFGALVFSLFASLALFYLMPGHLSVLNWTHADRARPHPWFCRGHRRPCGIDHQTQHRCERFRKHASRNRRRARFNRQLAFHRAAFVFLSATRNSCAVNLAQRSQRKQSNTTENKF